jgi:Predicted dehydrogenases and related proteins
MQKKADGQNYAPVGKAVPVCVAGEFPIGVIGLEHGHIYGMCNGLCEAGATVELVWDEDAAKIAEFCEKYPDAKIAASKDEVLASERIKLIASAGIPNVRGSLGIEVLRSGKDYFADKPPLTTMEQLAEAKKAVEETGKKFGVYYSERLHVEAAVHAGKLIEEGTIGRVIQVMGWGPHRLNAPTRPSWFFDKEQYGGILVDIGCHQIEQILTYAGATDATINYSRMANYAHKEYEQFEDYGDVSLTCDNGVAAYFRVDWFTPAGLGAWGDGRTIIVGTEGYIEIRKYIDIANSPEGDHVYLVNKDGEQHFKSAGTCGFPFFGAFIRDCLDRTEHAMSQSHAFKAVELAIRARDHASRIE